MDSLTSSTIRDAHTYPPDDHSCVPYHSSAVDGTRYLYGCYTAMSNYQRHKIYPRSPGRFDKIRQWAVTQQLSYLHFLWRCMKVSREPERVADISQTTSKAGKMLVRRQASPACKLPTMAMGKTAAVMKIANMIQAIVWTNNDSIGCFDSYPTSNTSASLLVCTSRYSLLTYHRYLRGWISFVYMKSTHAWMYSHICQGLLDG